MSLLFFDKDAVFPTPKYKKLAQAEEAEEAEEKQTATKEETNG